MHPLQAPDYRQKGLLIDHTIKTGINLRRKSEVDESGFILKGDKHHALCRTGGLLDQHHAEGKDIAIGRELLQLIGNNKTLDAYRIRPLLLPDDLCRMFADAGPESPEILLD